MSGQDSNHSSEMAKGALIYFLGLPGKFAGFLVMWVAARYYGSFELGVYVAAWALIQVALKLSTGGLSESLSLQVAQLTPKEERENLNRPDSIYRLISNCLYIGIMVAILVILGFHFGLHWILENNLSQERLHATKLISWLVPLHLIIQLAVSSTRGLLKVQYDMWINFIIKQSLFLFVVLGGIFFEGLEHRLIYIQILVHLVAAIIAIKGMSKWFDLSKCLKWYGWDSQFLKMSFPLSLNDLLAHFTQELDLIMLTLYASINELELSYYGVAISIVFGIRMLRRNFMKVFVPLASNYMQYDQWEELNENYNSTQRWILYLALPLLCIFLLFPQNILQLYNPEYTKWDQGFMILALGSFVNSFLGMYGALVFSSGKTYLVLVNSGINVGLNALFNWFLIPRLGVLGASIATALSMTISHFIMIGECGYLFKKLRTDYFGITKTFLVFLIPSALIYASRDSLSDLLQLRENLLAASLFSLWLLLIVITQVILKFHPSDQVLVSNWLEAKKSPTN